jgi:hypothetical protein
MATGKIKVNVVDVGQGQCTFVEIYNTANTLVHTLLFDCGSDHRSVPTLINLQYIANTVSAMAVPAFDLLAFSHSDNDHVSLMRTLLGNFVARPTVKKVVYGGNYNKYKKRGYNVLIELVKQGYCTSDKLFAPRPDASGFNRDTGLFGDPMWVSDDGEVRVDLMVGNVINDLPEEPDEDEEEEPTLPVLKGAEALNRVSLICRVLYNGFDYIICGDATNRTMSMVNYYFTGKKFAYVPMVTVPHHGSRATGLDVSEGKTPNEAAIKNVATFAKICNGRTVTASSYEKHGHPSMELIHYFKLWMANGPLVADARLGTSRTHLLVSYVDIPLVNLAGAAITRYHYTSYATPSNLYGTNYHNPVIATLFTYNYAATDNIVGNAPPVTGGVAMNSHACWVYTADSLKNDKLEGATQLPAIPTTVFTRQLTGAELSAPASAPPLPPLRTSLGRAPAGLFAARLRAFR